MILLLSVVWQCAPVLTPNDQVANYLSILIALSHSLFYFYSSLYYSSNGREARNRAEKNRRDKLNGSIQELSMMVPHVADSPRRVDKTAVLRFSAHTLRINYGKFRPFAAFVAGNH